MEFVHESRIRSVSASRHAHARDAFGQNGHSGIGDDDDFPAEAHAFRPGTSTLMDIQQSVVERLNGQRVRMADVLAGRVFLALVDDRTSTRHRTAAAIAWVEERLDPDVRLVLVWSRRPVTLRRLSPTRAGTLNLVDREGELRQILENAGSRKALLIDAAAGTVETADENSDIFSLGREIRATDARGSDHVIDLGDLT